MIARMFGHTALAGHFIILLSIYLYIIEDDLSKEIHRIICWILLCILCILVHPYFIVMVGIILLGSCVKQSLKEKKHIIYALIRFIACVIFTLGVFYVIGGFQNMKSSNINGGNLGQASLNLNGFFNSYNVAGFFKALPSGDVLFSSEGYNYLGVGIIVLLPFLVVYLVKKLISKDEKNKIATYLPIAIMFIIYLFFSLGPKIYCGDALLFSYKLPTKLMNIWGIFQSTGRIFWPVTYAVTFLSLIALYNIIKDRKKLIIVFGICLIFQNLEKTQYLSGLMWFFNNIDDIQSADILVNPIWEDIIEDSNEIVLLNCLDVNQTIPFMIKGAETNIYLNFSCMARVPIDKIDKVESEKARELLEKGVDDNIYIINSDEYAKQIEGSLDEKTYDMLIIDGYTVLVKKGLVDLGNYDDIKRWAD